MLLFEALILTVATVVGAVWIHYEGLGLVSRWVRGGMYGRARVLYVVLGTIVAHLVEIFLYGMGYEAARLLGLGRIAGPHVHSLLSVFYFSAETFTSLGFGDNYPTGHLRLMAGVECLNGFILIGWSTSFTYLSMRNFWDEVGRL